MDDTRKVPRRRTLLEGHIELSGGGAIDCTVRNLSGSGARLRVVSVVGIPEEFVLSFGAEAERRPVKIVWRKETELGVTFVAA